MLDTLSEFFFGDQRRKYVALLLGFGLAELIVVFAFGRHPSPQIVPLLVLLSVICTAGIVCIYDVIRAWTWQRDVVWRTVGVLGLLAGFVACAVNVRTTQSLRRAEALVEKSHGLILRIELERPRNGEVMRDYVTEIAGRIDVRADSGEPSSGRHGTEEELKKRGLELVSVVHPLATDDWWVQPPLRLNRDGSFRGLVYIGEKELGKGESFEIATILVPRGSFGEGRRLRDIPMTYGSSSIIKVQREM